MKKIIFACSVLMLLLYSCSPQLYIPKESASTVSLEDLKKGREIYVKKCASCHQLHLPAQFDEKVWSINLDEMQSKANITDEEKQLIYQYIVNAPKKK